jgi:hypothetical protein
VNDVETLNAGLLVVCFEVVVVVRRTVVVVVGGLEPGDL